MTPSPRSRFVEDFAAQLHQMGLAHMHARVFSVLLASPEGPLTARELADELGVSPAAISGAVRFLTQFRMVTRTRLVGERVDRYYVGERFWETAVGAEASMYASLIGVCDRALADVDLGSARARLEETRDFLDFISAELPKIVTRWHDQRVSAGTSGDARTSR